MLRGSILVWALVLVSCGGSDEARVIRLVDVFDRAVLEGAPPAPEPGEPTEWSFDSLEGVRAISGIAGLEARGGFVHGKTTGDLPVLDFARTAAFESRDQFHALEVRMRASGGANIAVEFLDFDPPNEAALGDLAQKMSWLIRSPLLPGDEMKTYRLESPRPLAATAIRRIALRPTDQAGVDFAIDSVRVVFRREHLASIESGIGFQGMTEIYRESIVSRAPEVIRIPVEVPSRALLEVALGTVDDAPVRFRLAVSDRTLIEQTISTPYRWEERFIDLAEFGGTEVTLALSLESEHEGAIGVWGNPVVRQRTASSDSSRPRGLILLWADTLRQDHLELYGYARETMPAVKRMASEGVMFRNAYSQATWTKVSTPSLLTSLYPSTHGVKDFSHHLPSTATTLAELYRDAGYATVSFASNLFTGQFTNLHQGFEEVHEDGSLPEVGSSKTSRAYVDRLTRWLERHRDVPFFVFAHLYDPHDPFEPRPPYDRLWADPEKKTQHVEDHKRVVAHIQDPLAQIFGMPSGEELTSAGVDPEAYVAFNRDWYDGSIRGMDAEIGRVLERLRELNLDSDTLVVFAADHGEEFLEHGRTFHGQSVYGELTRVPLVFRWPRGIASGGTVEAVTQTIDVMPTLLTLSGIAHPDGLQGQSLAPLLLGDESRFREQPAFSEKARTEELMGAPWPRETESYSVVEGRLKLIHNRVRPEGTPEYELFDIDADPLDRKNIAAERPEEVKRLSELLDGWYKMANAARLPPDSATMEGLSQEQLERLRSLGYIK